MKIAASALALALVLGALNPMYATAHTPLRWGFFAQPTSVFDAGACVSTARVWLQELGRSGVTRLKAKFERRAPYDTGLPGLSYETRGWLYSLPFPDDGRSLYLAFQPWFRYPAGGEYHIRAVMVGERPSFWRPDHKLKASLGRIGCEAFQPGEA